jgi:hypothetical protein
MILNLRYKGNRDYLQGADIYQAVNQFFKAKGGFVNTISFRSFAKNQLQIKLEKPTSASSLIAAEGSVSYPTGEEPFWLVVTDETVNERYPFEESMITAAATMSENSVYIDNVLAFSLIELIVALCKYFSYADGPPLSGKWIFGKLIILQELPESWQSLRISRTTFLEGRFNRFSLSIDADHYGEILFIIAPI